MGQSVKGLTIEIGGDTTSLQSALNKCNTASKSLQTELNFVNKALKLDPSNVELVTQKKQLLKEAISTTKDKLDALKQAQAQADQLMQDGVEVNQEEYRKLQREIAFSEDKLKSYRTELVETQLNLANVAKNTKKFGESVEDMGKKLMGVTTAIGVLAIASGKMASDYEDAIAKVSTIADTTQVSMEDMSSAIMDLSNTTGVAATDIAENVYNAISAGQKTGDAVNFVSNATTLARAGFAETGDALDILTTIMNAYGLEASEVTRVSDMLIQTQNLGKTTVGDLASAMGKVIPTANSMNVGLDQLTASYTILTAKGIATAESTTYINSMLNELGKSSTVVGGILQDKTGQSFQELMASGSSLGDVLQILQDYAIESGTAFNELWSSAEAGKAGISLLSDGVDSFNARVVEMNNSTGSTAEAYDKLNTTSFQTQIIINQLKNDLIVLGTTLLQMLAPALEKVSSLVSQFSTWVSGLTEAQKQQIITIAGVVASVAPLLVIIGKVISKIGSLVGYLDFLRNSFTVASTSAQLAGTSIGAITLPIVAIIAVIATLVLAFKHLWETNETFRNNIIEIWDGIKAKFTEFTQGIVDRLNALGFDFENITDVIKALWEGLCDLLAPLFEGAFSIVSAVLGAVFDVLTGLLDIFIGLFTGNWDQLWKGVEEVFSGVWNGIVGVFTTIIGILEGLFDAVCGWFGTTWSKTWNNIKQFFIDTWNNIVSFFISIGTNITALFTTMWESIVNFFTSGIPTFIANVIAWLQELPYNIGLIIGTIIGNIIQFGIDVISWIKTNVPLFIESVISFISQLPSRVWEWLVATITNIIQWGVNMVANAKEIGSSFIENIITFIKTLPTRLWTWLVEAVNKIITWKNDLITKGKDAINGMITAIVSTAQSIPGKMLEIGRNIVEGVWQGICNAKDAFLSNIQGFFSGLVDGVKGALGIHSPSTVFADEVGEWIPPGVSQGINKTAGVVNRTIGNMVDGAILTARNALESLQTIGGVTVGATALAGVGDTSTVNNVTNNNNVTINAETVDRDHIDEIVDEVNRKLGDKL